MTPVAIADSLDQARTVSSASPLDRVLRGTPHVDYVHPVHQIGRHVEAEGSLELVRLGERLPLGRRVGVHVVLDHNHQGQAPEYCGVQRFGECPVVGSTLASECDRDVRLATVAEGERCTGRLRERRTDDTAAGEAVLRIEQMHVPTLPAAEAGHLAEDLSGQFVRRYALRERMVMRPVRTDDSIRIAEVHPHADRDRLLADRKVHLAADRAGCHVELRGLADVVAVGDRLLERPDQTHLPVRREQDVRRQASLLDGVPQVSETRLGLPHAAPPSLHRGSFDSSLCSPA
ncbi:hypothetical protein HRbin27_00071 [bacterium HR27]|nr:hypothetical protein HRbin27_00071 [bacterium HR27]